MGTMKEPTRDAPTYTLEVRRPNFKNVDDYTLFTTIKDSSEYVILDAAHHKTTYPSTMPYRAPEDKKALLFAAIDVLADRIEHEGIEQHPLFQPLVERLSRLSADEITDVLKLAKVIDGVAAPQNLDRPRVNRFAKFKPDGSPV